MAYNDLFGSERILLEFIASIESNTDINFLTEQEISNYEVDLNKFTMSVKSLILKLEELGEDATEEDITFWAYECAKPYYGDGKPDLKKWFKHFYMVWEHKENGPRLGTFIRCFGVENFIRVLKEKIYDPWRFSGFQEDFDVAVESMTDYRKNKEELAKEKKKYVIKCKVLDGYAKVYHEIFE